ncbi:MAG: type III-A CRISPR-associated RAMP protein Csm3 [Thermodesulfobacteriota bacterium]
MQLLKHLTIIGTIRCETGLHIGGSTEEIEIGGVDLPIIKHPVTKEPYIPGSSLKGKMRSELEKKYNKTENGDPCGCGREDCLICRVFGPHKNTKHNLGPTRILVRDCPLSNKSRQEYNVLIKEKGIDYIEKKTENIIDRMRGTASHPRTQERVPAGAEFDLEITLQVFNADNENMLKQIVKEGLELVEKSYLGGSGSRGYGKVKFLNMKIDGQPWKEIESQ